ncbi:PO113 protein, partial [Illadopsis cleaveri]|nr:PO113 protein [Illadopsis cleaveri]
PLKRYHWLVLPQGMKNSPTICQWYVAGLLSPMRTAFLDAVILHYMDDILVCARDEAELKTVLQATMKTITDAGFEIQPDKVQLTSPWKYLGLRVFEQTITPQEIVINTHPRTLNEMQQLCGSINWVRPLLGITSEDLAPLFNLLKGDSALNSPRQLTAEAKTSIQVVQEALSARQAHQYDPCLQFRYAILGSVPHLHGLIFQWDSKLKDSLIILEWVFNHAQPTKTTTTPQEAIASLIRKGCDFSCIYVPLATAEELEFLLQRNDSLQFALDSYPGTISIHYPGHKLFKANFNLIPKFVQSKTPLEAVTVFTDGSGSSHKSVMTWKDPRTQKWESDVRVVEGSPQVAELAAVIRAFQKFKDQPFNLVTDSAYVAGVAMRAEHSILREVSNKNLYLLLSKLVFFISHRKQPFHVMHVRSHTDLPGAIVEGNRRADMLAMAIQTANVPDTFQQAKLSHQFFHQNTHALSHMFHLTREQAKAIVASCPQCQSYQVPFLDSGVNPRGLNSNEIWQTDVTHYQAFGCQKYIHVSVDTFSGAIFASAHAGENATFVKRHFYLAFASLGVPKQIKTDNGPAYTSKHLRSFFQDWGIQHTTGIPHSPTGQSVVERTHQTLKRVLDQQ